MSLLANEEHKEKRDAFFGELEMLISRYPEMTQRPRCNHPDCETCGDYDDNASKMVTGIVLVITTRNTQDIEEIIWEKPYGQSAFHTIGMLHEAYKGAP